MPTYLRWIAAITAGITTQFAFFILVGAIAVGTGNTEPGEGVGLLVTLGAFLASVIPTLAVNDWLAKRHPPEPKRPTARADAPVQSASDSK